MAKRLAIPSKELALTIVGPKDSFKASRVQRLTLNSEIPTTTVDELGNSSHAGITADTPNVTLTFSAFDTSIKTFSVLTGTDATAYPAAGVDIENLGEVDAIVGVKDDSVSDYVKTAHAKRLQVRDFSYSYSVTGDSTEDYTAIGSEKRWFKNDVIVDRYTTGTTSFTLTQTPIQLKNGNYALSAILDGEYLTETAAAPAAGEYRIVGTTVTTGDSRTSQLLVVYHASPAGNNWSDVSDSTVPASIRGKDVKIEIGANDIKRVQSVTINGNLNPQPTREMGNRSIVGYQRQVPTVDGTITVLDTDTELIDLIVNGAASADTEFQIGGGCAVSGISLEVILYDPCVSGVILKTIYIPQLRVTSDGFTSNVNDNAQQTFNWMSNTAECVVYSGAR